MRKERKPLISQQTSFPFEEDMLVSGVRCFYIFRRIHIVCPILLVLARWKHAWKLQL
jgi:hypothetical protein